jgi:hypothetical protein
MARTKRSKQIAQFLGRQSPLPGMPPSVGRVASLGMARPGQVNRSGNVRNGKEFDVIVKNGRVFHKYAGRSRRSRLARRRCEACRAGCRRPVRAGLRAARSRPEKFNRRDVSTREPKVKGRKKLVAQFVNKNWKF